MTGDDLAIVIVSWNVRELLRAALRSLFADLEQTAPEAQVWVVDNGSADGTPEMIAEEFPAVHLRAVRDNLGFAAGNNLALREIRRRERPPRYIWLLNPDTEVQPGAVAALSAALDANPQVGVAGARLIYPDGSFQHSAFRFPGLLQLTFDLFPLPPRLYESGLNGRYPRRLYAGESPFRVDHPLGAAMMVRLAAIEQVGLLDEGYRVYCEEIDWCWRMRRAGWGSLCVPTAVVVHHAGKSTEQVPVRSFLNLWLSRARLYRLHHAPPTRRLAYLLVRAGMRRRIRTASPEMAAACREIIRGWEAAMR